MKCLSCKSDHFEILKEPIFFAGGVTGDRRIITNNQVKKVICKECGHIQHWQDDAYLKLTQEIFSTYASLHVKNHSAQKGGAEPRLRVISRELSAVLENLIPESKEIKVLDIGCGCGEFFDYVYEVRPAWQLYGMDVSSAFREEIISKKQVKGFFTTVEEAYGETYDLVTINTAICMMSNIAEILDMIRKTLRDEGLLYVLETDFEVQPYDLNVIEQSSFFTQDSLEAFLKVNGFEILPVEIGCAKKECAVLAKKGEKLEQVNLYENNKKIYEEQISRLDQSINTIHQLLQSNKRIGIFGTSMAGTWCGSVIQDYCQHHGMTRECVFIEEDADILRSAGSICQIPIITGDDIAEGTHVILPFPTYLGEMIKKRYEEKYEGKEIAFYIT